MAESHRDEIAKLESMYAANPEGRVFTHLAEAYRKAGDLVRAREVLEDGLRRHTDSASGFVVLGRVMQDLDQPQEAAGAFARVLELDPENRVALRALGDLAHAAGRSDEALAHFEQLLVLDPSDEAVETLVTEIKRSAAAAPVPAAEEQGSSYSGTTAGFETTSLPPEGVGAFGSLEEAGPTAAAGEPAGATELGPPDLDLGGPATGDAEAAGAPAEPQAAAPGSAEPERVLPSLDVSWLSPAPEEAAALPAPEAGAEAGVGAEAGPAQPGEEAPPALEIPAAAPEPLPSWKMAGEEPEAAPGPDAGEPAELVTETMAELYRSQGHLERAAEVYRALLRERPGDEQLERKLLEVELAILTPEEAAPAGASETPESVAPLPEGFTAGEPEGHAAGAEEAVQPAASAAAEVPESPAAEPMAAEQVTPEPDLAAEPGFAAPPFAEEASGLAAAAAGLTELPEGAAWEEPLPPVESFGYGALEAEAPGAAGPFEPWTDAAAEEATPAEAPVPTMEQVWSGGGDVPVEEPTPYAWEAGSAEEDAGPPVSTYLQGLLSWRLTVAPAWAAPEPAAPVEEPGLYKAPPEPATDWASSPESYEPYEPPQVYESQGYEPPAPYEPPAWIGTVPEPATPTWADEAAAEPWESEAITPAEPAERAGTEDLDWLTGPGGLAPESPAQPPAGAPPGSEAPDVPGDDDDLEMFRAWLQSLKK